MIFQVNITEDGTTEDEESFLVKLEVPLYEPAVVLGLNTTSIIIASDFNGKHSNTQLESKSVQYFVMHYYLVSVSPGCDGNQTDCEDVPKALSPAIVATIVGISLIIVLAITVALVMIFIYRCKVNKKKREVLRG